MPAESDFLEWLRAQRRQTDLVVLPQGDDLAVLKWRGEDLLLIGVDQVLDGVHFDSGVHSPREIGGKVMNRNLSDCAAMACLPAAAVVSAALPRGAGMEYAKELYVGMKEAGARFGCEIVGGDTGTWEGKLALSVTIMGRSDGMALALRAGAQRTARSGRRRRRSARAAPRPTIVPTAGLSASSRGPCASGQVSTTTPIRDQRRDRLAAHR